MIPNGFSAFFSIVISLGFSLLTILLFGGTSFAFHLFLELLSCLLELEEAAYGGSLDFDAVLIEFIMIEIPLNDNVHLVLVCKLLVILFVGIQSELPRLKAFISPQNCVVSTHIVRI